MRRSFIITILALAAIGVQAQDSSRVLTLDQALWMVSEFHPLSQQADLKLARGQAKVLESKGKADPLLSSTFNQKYYDQKDYYSLASAGLEIPTWYAVSLEAGYDQNSGEFLNPQFEMPEQGLIYAGISVPVLQGLIIDERRARLKQARFYERATSMEQKMMLNKMYFETIRKYLKWMETYAQYDTYRNSADLAYDRYEAVQGAFEYGDLPAVDTLEAYLQWQNRSIQLNAYLIEFIKAGLDLSNELWSPEGLPLEISIDTRPLAFDELNIPAYLLDLDLPQMISQIDSLNPELAVYNYRIAELEVEKKLMREMLKPDLELKYHALLDAGQGLEVNNDLTQNYVWGVRFTYPILIRQERGRLAQAKINVEENEWKLLDRRREITNELRTIEAKQDNLGTQVDLYSSAVENYQTLLDKEIQRFMAGESSLFLVNSRELWLLEAQVRYNEIRSKYVLSMYEMSYELGMLGDQILDRNTVEN
jgi:outer membrane protein TolC